MKRLRVRPATALALLLCAGTVWLSSGQGVRAYTLWRAHDGAWALGVAPLNVWVERRTYVLSASEEFSHPKVERGKWWFGYMEFPLYSQPQPDGNYRHGWIRTWQVSSLVLPFVCLVCMSWLASGFIRWARRALRREQGRCPQCGYDLRATPDRCPECGASAERPAGLSGVD